MTISRRRAFKQILLAGAVGAGWFRASESFADTVSYQYDALGRVVSVTYPNGVVVKYAYDDAGNREQRISQIPGAPNGTFAASPTSITSGSSSTLSWTSTNATSASIDNGVGSVTPVSGGSTSVSPSTTTTYTLTLNGPNGQTTRQATVTVTPPPAFNATIAVTGSAPVNLRTLANTNGYNGAQDATVTFEVNNAVTIAGAAGAPDGGIAIDTGTWPTGSYTITLTLVVKSGGVVRGGGGRGGAGAAYSSLGGNGGVGGDAIYCRLPMAINVNSGGVVQAGGGGGGGGVGSLGGWPSFFTYGGGGGGGGFPNASGGAGAGGTYPGSAGQSGTTSSGGAGGQAASPSTGHGGAGGGAGQTGANGATNGAPPGSGGAAGYAIRKNGHTVTVTNNGTVTGTQG